MTISEHPERFPALATLLTVQVARSAIFAGVGVGEANTSAVQSQSVRAAEENMIFGIAPYV